MHAGSSKRCGGSAANRTCTVPWTCAQARLLQGIHHVFLLAEANTAPACAPSTLQQNRAGQPAPRSASSCLYHHLQRCFHAKEPRLRCRKQVLLNLAKAGGKHEFCVCIQSLVSTTISRPTKLSEQTPASSDQVDRFNQSLHVLRVRHMPGGRGISS